MGPGDGSGGERNSEPGGDGPGIPRGLGSGRLDLPLPGSGRPRKRSGRVRGPGRGGPVAGQACRRPRGRGGDPGRAGRTAAACRAAAGACGRRPARPEAKPPPQRRAGGCAARSGTARGPAHAPTHWSRPLAPMDAAVRGPGRGADAGTGHLARHRHGGQRHTGCGLRRGPAEPVGVPGATWSGRGSRTAAPAWPPAGTAGPARWAGRCCPPQAARRRAARARAPRRGGHRAVRTRSPSTNSPADEIDAIRASRAWQVGAATLALAHAVSGEVMERVGGRAAAAPGNEQVTMWWWSHRLRAAASCRRSRWKPAARSRNRNAR